MTKPLTNVTYCAYERPTYEKDFKLQIDYTEYLGAGTSITQTVKVRDKLYSIDKITNETIETWSKSNTAEDFFKEKDHQIISEALTFLGKEVKVLSLFVKKDYHFTNGGCYLKERDSRKLKTFEKDLILKSYNHK
jgi:hypothetical protein